MSNPTRLNQVVRLSVGEVFHLKLGRDRVIYAGMPSEDVYSIVQLKSSGYRGYSWNLYFPRRRRDIIIDGVRIYVESVTPEEIELRPV